MRLAWFLMIRQSVNRGELRYCGAGRTSACARNSIAMRSRHFFALTFLVCLAAAIIATVVQPHFRAVEYFTWPGMGISLVVFVLVHADYFGHPRLITCLDILFNALLWAAIISLIRALLRATIWRPLRSG